MILEERRLETFVGDFRVDAATLKGAPARVPILARIKRKSRR